MRNYTPVESSRQRGWTEKERTFMRRWYGIIPTALLAECVHHTYRGCEAEAGRLGLRAPQQRTRFRQFYEGRV
jgi:hypothetical protein